MTINAKNIIGVLLIFILGAATGALTTHFIHHSRMERFIGGAPHAREEHIIKRLTKELDLDGNQQERSEASCRRPMPPYARFVAKCGLKSKPHLNRGRRASTNC
ncbi:MAG: hypothetical protein WCP33_05140 [Deltaproteobacteria bacterium]